MNPGMYNTQSSWMYYANISQEDFAVKRFGLLIMVIISAGLLSGCDGVKPEIMQEAGRAKEELRTYSAFGVGGIDEGDGYYYSDANSFIYYFDYESKTDEIVCSISNCKHEIWDETTPSEQRCTAYIVTNLAGFVSGDRLFLFIQNGMEAELVVSDLDRSNCRSICKFNTDFISNFAVRGNDVYIVLSNMELETGKDGVQIQTGRNVVKLVVVDLVTGKTADLSEPMLDYGNNLLFIGALEDDLYMMYSYNEKPDLNTSAVSMLPKITYFKYSTSLNELTSVLMNLPEGKAINYGYLKGEDLYTMVSFIEMSDGNRYKSTFSKVNVETGEIESIDDSTGNGRCFGSDWFYQTIDGERYAIFDCETGKRAEISGTCFENMAIIDRAGDYYFGIRNDSEKDEQHLCFFDREELFKGNLATVFEHVTKK